MNVLQIANYKPGTGGISGQVEKIHACLDEEGINNAIFSVKGSTLYRLKAFFKLAFTGRHYDVFHIHTCSYGGFLSAVIGVTIGKLLKKRIVLTYHGGGGLAFFEKRHRFVRFFLTKTDTNIVLSGFLGEIFEKFDIPYTIIPNIIEFDKGKFRERESIRPKFISIRSLEPLYNIPCILKAFQLVKKDTPEATLLIVGGGSQKELLEQFVTQNKISGVTFTGRVDNSKIYEYLDQSDIMLSSPTIDNMPVSLLEAFNAGLLVISSNVGGIPYMIEDGKNGLLFNSDNPQQLAEKMLFAVNNPEQTLSMTQSANGSLWKYTWKNVKPMLFQAYNYQQ